MKRLVNILLVVALALPVIAADRPTPEERANADFSAWLPQQGEYSLGFNIDPLATFVGNFFNGTMGNGLAPFAGEPLRVPGMVSIMGSYMLTDNLAARANVGLGIYGGTNRAYVIDDAEKFMNPYSTLEGLDKQKWLDLGASFSAGIEYRVGKRRVQGVFGAGLTYGFWGINRNQYFYYNAITAANQNPSNGGLSAGMGVNAKFATDYSYIDNPRLLDKHTATGTHILGVYGSAGVEWFVAPKIALGLNVNLLLDYTWDPARVEVWEGWNHFTQEKQEITIHDQALNTGFSFTTDNIGANLYIAFYFGK